MAHTYTYRALDAGGEIQVGELLGEDPLSVADRLRRMGLRPVSVDRKRGQALAREITVPGFRGKRNGELATLSRQFATMVGAGVPIVRCLEVLVKQTENPALRNAVETVLVDVENGDALSVAMARQPSWFDRFFISMVEAGEGAGALAVVLDRLATANEKAAQLTRKVRGALAYPVVVAGMAVLIVLAMILFLIPRFKGIYADFGGELPLLTRVMLGVSGLLWQALPVVLLGSIAGGFWFRRWKQTPDGHRTIDRWKLGLPIFGGLLTRTALARFSRSMSVLVTSGLPIIEALDIAKETAGNQVVADSVTDVAERVANGSPLSDGLTQHPAFTAMVVQMVAVGEETGDLESMLDKVAELYEDEVDESVSTLTSLIQPLLIVFMGTVIAFVLFSVYLPMFRAIDLVR